MRGRPRPPRGPGASAPPTQPGRHEEGDAVDQPGLRERAAELPAALDEHRVHAHRPERVEQGTQVHAAGVGRQFEHARALGAQGRGVIRWSRCDAGDHRARRIPRTQDTRINRNAQPAVDDDAKRLLRRAVPDAGP